MIDHFIGWVAPHICEGCGVVGSTLCSSCNFHILADKYSKCVDCGQGVEPKFYQIHGNMCSICNRKLPFDHVSVVGKRDNTLKKLVGNFKYFSHRSTANALSDLITHVLPADIPLGTVIVYTPTAPKHIRQRGFDHMELVARSLARKNNLSFFPVMKRLDNKSQHSANLRTRRDQAQASFSVKDKYRNKLPESIILIDDIYTTGSTVKAIAKMLKCNGAKKIWLAIVARN